MDKSEKYELIVKLKELYSESFIPKDDLDLYYNKNFIWIAEKKYNEISLYASKILQVIHENEILKKMYETMTTIFTDLKGNKEYFKQAIKANNERITYFIGDDANIWKYPNEFIFQFVRFNPKSFFDISNLNIGILNLIYHICCIYKTEYISGQENELVNVLHNDYNYNYYIDSFDEQESYNDKLCITYDYYVLSKFDDIAYIDTPDIAIFLLVACKKVLFDMLDNLYIIDLSSEEKENRIKESICKSNLTDEEIQILKLRKHLPDNDFINIGKALRPSLKESSVKQKSTSIRNKLGANTIDEAINIYESKYNQKL